MLCFIDRSVTYLLCLIFICFGYTHAHGQCDGNISLSTQGQVDSFNILYGCSTINGDLTVTGDSITHLDSLYSLDSILGSFYIIDNSILEELSGLENLNLVNGEFAVEGNTILTDLAAIDSFIVIESLSVLENDSLSVCDLYWICNFIQCSEEFTIEENGPGCYTENEGILSCGCILNSSLTIETIYLSDQEDVDMMPHYIENCGLSFWDIEISGSDIEYLDSLQILNQIFGEFLIENCDSLTTLNGLENIQFIGNFSLVENTGLTDISMLDSNLVIFDGISITDNLSLSACDVPWVCKAIQDNYDNYSIDDNNGLCAQASSILNKCPCISDFNRIDIELNTQSEVDSLPLLLSACGGMVRDLTISNGLDIINLDSLKFLEEVFGTLTISDCDRLKNLEGLESLRIVGNDLRIEYNDSLTSFKGLQSLECVTSMVRINYNDQITDLDSLHNIQMIGEGANISANPLLEVCEYPWLCKIAGITDATLNLHNNAPGCNNRWILRTDCICTNDFDVLELVINTQAQLDSLKATFETCPFRVSKLRISFSNITNVDSLCFLDSIMGSVEISNNNSLTDLSGLSNLVYIGEQLTMRHLNNLTDISTLNPNLYIGSSLTIFQNNKLSTCDVDWVCNHIKSGKNYYVANNDVGCYYPMTTTSTCACDYGIDTLNIVIGSQTDIDMIPAAMDSCDFVLGWVQLGFGILGTISNLDSLIDIDSIYGDFDIFSQTTDLPNLSGLKNLKYVSGGLTIHNCQFDTISGLDSLDYIGGALIIQNNTDLSDISNFHPDLYVAENLFIAYNSNLNVCDVPFICNYFSYSDTLAQFVSNGEKCNIGGEILSACGCPGTEVLADLHLSTQSDIDALPALLNGCPFRINNLLIEDQTPLADPITTLDSLYILDSIYGNLDIRDIYKLTSIRGLKNLEYVGRDIDLDDLPLLESLTGLENITRIPDDLELTGLTKIENFDGLNNLDRVGEDVEIEENFSLIDFSGLESLESVGKGFGVAENSNLKSFGGLDNLVSIGEELEIEENFSLKSLFGLDNLRTVGEEFIIESNPNLLSIANTSLIQSIGEDLRIEYNPKLSACNLGWICDHISDGKPNSILLNSPGCSNKNEISVSCDCPFNLILPMANGLYRAQNEISTSGQQILSELGVYDAPNVLLQPGFEVPKGTSLLILQKGCE